MIPPNNPSDKPKEMPPRFTIDDVETPYPYICDRLNATDEGLLYISKVEVDAKLREVRKGLADADNHWHHPASELKDYEVCTACDSLKLLDELLKDNV